MKLRYQMRGLGLGIIVTALLMGVTTDNKIPLSDAEIKLRALELGMVESDSLKLSDIPVGFGGDSKEDGASSSGADGTMAEGGDGASDPGTEGTDGTNPEEDASEPDSPGDAGSGDGGGAPGDGGDAGSGNDGGAPGGGGDAGSGDDGGAPGDEGDAGSGDGDGAPGDEGAENGDGAVGGEGGFGDAEGSSHGGASGDLVTVVIERGATSYRVCQELERLGLVEDAARFDDYLCDIGYSKSVRQGTFQIPMGTSEEEIAKIITGNR